MKIEFVFEKTCPNARRTKEILKRALRELGIVEEFKEWDRDDPSAPEYVKNYPSPTILVDGKDLFGENPSRDISACRIYTLPDGSLSGAPTFEMVLEALKKYSHNFRD